MPRTYLEVGGVVGLMTFFIPPGGSRPLLGARLRHCDTDGVTVYERSSVLAMRSMAPIRVAWMVDVVRGTVAAARGTVAAGS